MENNIQQLFENTNYHHLHESQSNLWAIVYCLIISLKEKGLLFPDEIRNCFEEGVHKMDKDEKSAQEEFSKLFKFILLEDKND